MLSMYWQMHKDAWQVSLQQFFKAPWASMVLVAVIGMAFSLPICLWVIAHNAKLVTNNWHHTAQISVFLDKNIEEAAAKTLLDSIRKLPLVAYANYISPKQGLQQLEEQTGMDDVVKLLDENPLPYVVEILPKNLKLEENDALINQLKGYKGVSQVKMDLQWLLRLGAMIELAQKSASGLMGLLCVAVLLVVGNAIRLSVMNRHQEIEVLKLIGATNSYIRRPFLYFGVMHGFLGALLAWGGISILVLWLQVAATRIATLYYTHFSLAGLSFTDGIALLLVGSSLGFLGAYVSVWKQIRRQEFSTIL